MREVIATKIALQVDQQVEYISCSIARCISLCQAKCEENAVEFLLTSYLPKGVKQPFRHRHKDKANLAISYTVFSLSFDQSKAPRQPYCFAVNFFIHLFYELICNVF